MKTFFFFALTLVLAMLASNSAQAGELYGYIDPFTGSLILQVLAMGFFAALAFLKQVRGFFLGLFGFKPATENDDESESVHDNEEVILSVRGQDDDKQEAA